jgi:putative tryptophan/tyrosine transport system substrate-binding protein
VSSPIHLVAAFRDGLRDTGFVEDQNVRIEYRWAEGQYDRLPQLASDLVNRQVAAIATAGNTPSAYAAKAATTIIPIVFVVGDDPIKIGLVGNLARPHGNLTGVTVLFGPLGPKRFEILQEVIPGAHAIGLLVNPNYPTAKEDIKVAQETVSAYRKQLIVQSAGSESELETAFANLVQQHVDGLVVNSDAFFGTRREQLTALAARYALPAIYSNRDFAVSGGLMSYGGDLRAAYHDAGGYVGRILKGAKPESLPVQQSTKFELVINLKTAKALGLTVPPSVLARADEVIE